MNDREALKLALEALEDLGMKHFENTGEVLYKETFTAIKEALAQPEQTPYITMPPSNPMWTIPAQRTWVELTNHEIYTIHKALGGYTANNWDYERAIEDKIKELNS